MRNCKPIEINQINTKNSKDKLQTQAVNYPLFLELGETTVYSDEEEGGEEKIGKRNNIG